MEDLRQYVISVVAAAFICGTIMGLLPKGSARELVKMICGLFLAFTVLSPISRFDFSRLAEIDDLFTDEAAQAAAMGENLNREALHAIIKAETEAYILDKAAQLNVELEVEVTVSTDDPPLPVAVSLSGSISPYARRRLEAILTDEIGIPKENQAWTG